MSTSMRWILFTTILATGCVSTSNEGIPCEDYDDQTCPTGYWCKSALLNNTRWVCVSEESEPRPELEFVGITLEAAGEEDDSDFEASIAITEETNIVLIRVRNVGGNLARLERDVPIESECCLGAETFSRLTSDSRSLEPGESADIEYRFARGTDDCPSQQQVTVEVSEMEAGATFSATFDVDFTPPTDRTASAVSCE